MRALLLALLLVAACRTSDIGRCTQASDCTAGSVCDPGQQVCVIPQNGCFPACAAGLVCQNSTCVANGCNPPCDSAHVCDTSSNQCVNAVTAGVSITSPSAGTVIFGSVQVTASAHAPGGVASLQFTLKDGGGTTVATAPGVAAGGDPSNYAATVSLNGVSDGPVALTATIVYDAEKSETSAAVALTVDQTAPTVAIVSDGRTTIHPGGATATVTATITDGAGSGISTAQLLLAGHAAINGAAGGAGAYTFSVPIDSALLAAGASGSFAFDLAATDGAGHTTTLSGDPKEVIKADRDAPAVTAIAYVTAPGYTDGSGHVFFDTTGGPISLTAHIADFAGVDDSTVCLRLSGETSACAHAGAGVAGTYTFSFPRPGGTQDGSASFDFTIGADDTLAAALSGASKAEHQAQAVQHIYFDNQPPAVSIAADTQAYARSLADGGHDQIAVSATIADPSGISSASLMEGATAVAPSFVDGGFYKFLLDATKADAGVEGPYPFTVVAQDNLGHSGSAGDSRNIDDAAPAASVKVFMGSEPTGAGVTYPTALGGTGYIGNAFLYSDTVRVKGALTDSSGIAAGATVHVDGIDYDGGVTAGVAQSLGCSAGGATCTFDLQVTLNDSHNGAFHTGAQTADGGSGLSLPFGALQVTFDAQDQALAGDGSAASHAGHAKMPVNATRLLWQKTLGAAVSGLAVHPDGDLLVTTDGGSGTDTVYDLRTDSPGIRWSYGADAGIGVITGQPAIGDDADGALIYVTSRSGTAFAFNPDGGVAWHQSGLANFSVAPAVATVSNVETVISPDNAGSANKLWAINSSTHTSVGSDDRDRHSSPLILGSTVWFGTDSGIDTHALATTPGASVPFDTYPGTFYGLVTDGTNVYAPQRGNTMLIALDQSRNELWAVDVTSSSNNVGASAEPTFDINGKLQVSDNNSGVSLVDTGDGSMTSLLTLSSGTGRVSLQGSDGHYYLPRGSGMVGAYAGGSLSWQLRLAGSASFRGGTMDCNGHVYVAVGSTVFALISDDAGLADTPWPSLRRDTRNTGNTNRPKYGLRTTSGCIP